MLLGSIFLLLAFLVLVVLFISRPFFEAKVSSVEYASSSDEHDLSSALADRDRILNTLHELDFDYDLGKIPEEDYQQQRSMLLEEGVLTLKMLDEMQGDAGEGAGEDRIETELGTRRYPAGSGLDGAQVKGAGTHPGTGSPVNDSPVQHDPNDELEAMLANRRRSRQEKAAGFCPNCGGPLAKSDQFCPRCGAKLV
jgi:hypothetical protein